MKRLILLAACLLTMSGWGQTLYERSRTYGDIEIHFDIDSVGPKGSRGVALRIPGELNGTSLTFTLDTGASVNVISTHFAKALGLMAEEDSVSVKGVADGMGHRAIADELSIGNITFAHVPFLIIDAETGDAAIDQHLRHLRAVLGRPLLEALGKLTFDFERHNITCPERLKKQKRTKKSNLRIEDNVLMLQAQSDDDTLSLIPDFGATHSNLGAEYFERHPEIAETGDSAVVYYAGVGGLVRQTEYRLHDFPLLIDGRKCPMHQITTNPSGTYESRLGMDFFSRQRRVVLDLRRWRLSIVPTS